MEEVVPPMIVDGDLGLPWGQVLCLLEHDTENRVSFSTFGKSGYVDESCSTLGRIVQAFQLDLLSIEVSPLLSNISQWEHPGNTYRISFHSCFVDSRGSRCRRTSSDLPLYTWGSGFGVMRSFESPALGLLTDLCPVPLPPFLSLLVCVADPNCTR